MLGSVRLHFSMVGSRDGARDGVLLLVVHHELGQVVFLPLASVSSSVKQTERGDLPGSSGFNIGSQWDGSLNGREERKNLTTFGALLLISQIHTLFSDQRGQGLPSLPKKRPHILSIFINCPGSILAYGSDILYF